ncbi:DUF5677 domain-containing protein [Colwellia sp. TT2012]|uniref:DUF5677 domain-containing protein n=1 Tax=Colwellia sp. TT2012 TaxID=1720342 RepID=UPI0007095F30|nr:DUF5677 domain-containing protein [Colwellia sp. TT2012]
MQRSFIEKYADNRRLKRMLKDLPESSTLKYKNVKDFVDTYRVLFTRTSKICHKLISSMELKELYSPSMLIPATLTLHYLFERVVVTPFHVINTFTRDPMYAHSDIAALNRGLFESAVNACFLVSKDNDLRFKKFFATSLKQEHHIQKSMDKWIDSENPKIKMTSNKQRNIKNATNNKVVEELKDLIGDVGQFPNIWERCEALGEDWMFDYDSKYRGLSAWQHGDVSRVFITHSMKQLDSSEAERPVFESMAQCSWAWDIMFKYAFTIQKVCNLPEISEELAYLNHIGYQAMKKNLSSAVNKFQGSVEESA